MKHAKIRLICPKLCLHFVGNGLKSVAPRNPVLAGSALDGPCFGSKPLKNFASRAGAEKILNTSIFGRACA